MAFITNTDTSILPYNDEYMKYDINRRQYVITVSGMENVIGVSYLEYFDTPNEVNAFLYECSDDLYEYIYSISRIGAVQFKRYYISKSSDIREDFKKALMAQVRYALRSSANLLKDQHGVSIEKGKALDLNSIRGRVGISPQSETILLRIGLLYGGFLTNYNYEDDGTY